MNGLPGLFLSVLRRDLRIIFRQGQQWLNPLAFFVIVISLFPLGVGPEGDVLQTLAAGVLWVAALLATLLSLDTLFSEDHADGTLEQMANGPQPLSVIVLAKITAHWVSTQVPLIVVSPVLAMMLGLPSPALTTMVVALAIGSVALSVIGAVGAALTVGLRHAGLLLSMVVLPLYVPVLIFGANAVESAAQGLPVEAQLSLLAAIAVGSVALAPWAIAAALRIGVDAE